MSKSNIIFCGTSHPSLPGGIIKNGSVIYHRMHGLPELYKSPYTKKELQKLFSDVTKQPAVKSAFIYFNNDIDGSAIANATDLVKFSGV